MKTGKKQIFMAAAMLALAAILAPQGGMAATAPCTEISNQATLDFEVDGVPQASVNSDGDGGTAGEQATTFNVGVKVIVTVADSITNYVNVTPSTTSTKELEFTVTNSGNGAHYYALSSFATTSGGDDPYSVNPTTFEIAPAKVAVYAESGATAGYQAGEDTDTFITSLASGATTTAYIVYTPDTLSAAKDAVAAYWLKVTTRWLNNTAMPAGPNNTATVTNAMVGGAACGAAGDPTIDVVYGYGDSDRDGSDDDRDGSDSDDGAFTVANAIIAVTKSHAVYSDPINNTSTPKAIPGAVVTYTLTVENTGNADATNVTISDDLDAEIATAGTVTFATQYNDGTTSCGAANGIVVDADGSGAGAPACKTNSIADDGAIDADFNVTGTNTVTVTGLSIAAGAEATIKFQVNIQ